MGVFIVCIRIKGEHNQDQKTSLRHVTVMSSWCLGQVTTWVFNSHTLTPPPPLFPQKVSLIHRQLIIMMEFACPAAREMREKSSWLNFVSRVSSKEPGIRGPS